MTFTPINAIVKKSALWNPWHGCHKLSEGCRHCYVYRGDAKREVDSSVVTQTKSFDAPVRRKRNGEYKIPSDTLVYTCFTSDFFVEDADPWCPDAWEMIRQRSDLRFMMITKRIDRLAQCLPADWGEGYDHVTICCTVENQSRADYRLPIYRSAPIRHKIIICEPLLERIDLTPYSIGEWVERVVVGGESGNDVRPCDFDWVMELRGVCAKGGVSFWFKQTGAKFIKDGRRALPHALYRFRNALRSVAGGVKSVAKSLQTVKIDLASLPNPSATCSRALRSRCEAVSDHRKPLRTASNSPGDA